MFVLALFWDRFELGRRRWLRGRPLRIGCRQLHTTQLISGGLFVVIGWLFLRFDGTAGITGVLGLGDTTELEFTLQERITAALATVPAWAYTGTGALVAGLWLLRRMRRPTDDGAAQPTPDGPTVDPSGTGRAPEVAESTASPTTRTS